MVQCKTVYKIDETRVETEEMRAEAAEMQRRAVKSMYQAGIAPAQIAATLDHPIEQINKILEIE